MGSLRMLIRLLEASSPAQMSQQHEEACVPVVRCMGSTATQWWRILYA